MSPQFGLLEKLKSWFAHATGGAGYARQNGDRDILRDARLAYSDLDRQPSARDEEERERELQILLATWL